MSKMHSPPFPPKSTIDSANELPRVSDLLSHLLVDSGRKSVDIPIKPSKAFSGRRLLSKYQLPVSQSAMYTSYVDNMADKRSVLSISGHSNPTPQRTKQEDILDYVYDWAAWAAEIPDPSRRSEALQSVMGTLERVLKSGMERTGVVLVPSDVKGTKNGTKKTLEGEVNIQVIITSNVKERMGKNVDQFAVRIVKDDVWKDKKADTGTAVLVPSESAPAPLMSIGEDSKAPQTKEKRDANEMGTSDVVQDIKRRKIEDEAAYGETKANTTGPANGEYLGRQANMLSEPISPMPHGGEEKQARYRQQIFQPRLNHILKKAGKAQTRGKCAHWETILARLKDAGVGVKYRNRMLRDFASGHEVWDGDNKVDPNEELAYYAEHGFEEALRKTSAATASKVETETGKQAIAPSQSDTATLLARLETLPALNAEPAIPGAFVTAQPVSRSSLTSENHAAKTTCDSH